MVLIISEVNTRNKNMIEVSDKLLLFEMAPSFFAFKSSKLFYPFIIKIAIHELASLSPVSVNEL